MENATIFLISGGDDISPFLAFGVLTFTLMTVV